MTQKYNLGQSLDTTGYTTAAKKLVEELNSLDVIPPRNGETYSLKKHRYITGENSSVMLTEQQANLCEVLANHADIPYWKAYVMAGYNYISYCNEAKNVKRIKAHLTGMCNQKMTPALTEFMNYLKYGAAEELKIDATWLLNEQVSLYEECRRNKMYTQAVRLLNDISYHVDVDSRVSNKLEVTEKVDYAAILSQADARVEGGVTIENSTELEIEDVPTSH